MKLLFLALMLFPLPLFAHSWKVCYWQDTGQIIDVLPYSHTFTPYELGKKTLPNGRKMGVVRFVLKDDSVEDINLVNYWPRLLVKNWNTKNACLARKDGRSILIPMDAPK